MSQSRVKSGDHLGFLLSGEAYAVPVGQVREVISLPTLTPVPEAPSWLSGVFPLRGTIVPLVDLRRHLHLGKAPDSLPEACAVVLRLHRGDDLLIVAIAVDEVLDVAPIDAAEVAPAPDLGARVEAHYLLGMRRDEQGRVTFLLDMDRILDPRELETLSNAQGAG
jgi:purine-binding chemotaxis protein CheW